MPIITIQLIQGRPEEKVKQLIHNVTATVCETLGAPEETVRVLVAELPKTHWGIGGIPVSEKQGK